MPEIRSNPTTVTTVSTPGTCARSPDVAGDRDRALLRRRVGQDDLHEHGALVFVGHEARRRDPAPAPRSDDHDAEDAEHDQGPARAVRRGPPVVVAHPVEQAVESLEESREQSAASLSRFVRLEQDRAQRRRQRQRDDAENIVETATVIANCL